MEGSHTNIQQRTEDFAVRVVKAYSELNNRRFDDPAKVLYQVRAIGDDKLEVCGHQ